MMGDPRTEILLGFDAREMWAPSPAPPETYTLRDDIEKVLSADVMIWPQVLQPALGEWIGANIPFWEDLELLKAAGAGLLLARWRTWCAVTAVVALGALSVGRMEVWRTERSLWKEAEQRAPGKVRPKVQFSRAVSGERAVRLLKEARWRRTNPR